MTWRQPIRQGGAAQIPKWFFWVAAAMGLETHSALHHLNSYPGPSGGGHRILVACRDVGSCNPARSRPPMAVPRYRM